MKLDKKQVPQVVLLGVLLLACIGYVGVQFSHKPESTPPKPAAEVKTDADNNNAPVQVQAVETTEEDMINLQLAALPPTKQRDPFSPQMSVDLGHSMSSAYQGPSSAGSMPRRITVPKSSVPKFASLPGMSAPFRVEPITVPKDSVDPQPGQAAVDKGFTVTGIIRGQQNVAILRSADERYIVREGQWINGTYKVVAITENGVVIVGKDRRISLRLGGEKNAS